MYSTVRLGQKECPIMKYYSFWFYISIMSTRVALCLKRDIYHLHLFEGANACYFSQTHGIGTNLKINAISELSLLSTEKKMFRPITVVVRERVSPMADTEY